MASIESVVRQHAQTTRLFGVDFLPRSSRIFTPAQADGFTPAPEPEQTRLRPVAEKDATHTMFELKPARRAEEPVLRSFSRPAQESGESDVAYAQRLLDALRARYEADAPHKHFVTAHTNIVFGEGHARARLCFVGEAPGEEEDKTGRPFVGRAGQLLNKMIAAMGLAREDVYICNVLKTRPPNNATPTEQEAALCEPYLLEQLSIVSPEVIVTLGLPASRLLLKTDESMGRMRGTWRELVLPDGRAIPVMPTYHPAFILRSYTEENRRKVWGDLRLVAGRLGLIV